MRILLAQVSLLPELLSKKINPWSLPGLAARNGFQGVEWLDRLLPSLEPQALRRLGEMSRKVGLGPGALSLSISYDASPARLAAQTRRCLDLLDACSAMGVTVVRAALARDGITIGNLLEVAGCLRTVAARRREPLGCFGRLVYLTMTRAGLARDRGHSVTPPPLSRDELERAAQALRPLAQKAADLGLALGVENHWGLSGRPDDLLYTISQLNKYNVGICLDLDNFYKDQDALTCVAALAPQTLHVHYKAHEGDASAEAKNLHYQARLDALRAVGYAGAFSVEYEGPPPGLSGSRRAAEVLCRLWEEPSA